MNVANFTPLASAAGGVLIGLAAALLWILNGRVAGISGIVGQLLHPTPRRRALAPGIRRRPRRWRRVVASGAPRLDRAAARRNRHPRRLRPARRIRHAARRRLHQRPRPVRRRPTVAALARSDGDLHARGHGDGVRDASPRSRAMRASVGFVVRPSVRGRAGHLRHGASEQDASAFSTSSAAPGIRAWPSSWPVASPCSLLARRYTPARPLFERHYPELSSPRHRPPPRRRCRAVRCRLGTGRLLPGPAIVSLGAAVPRSLVFVAAMVIGMALFQVSDL